MAKLPARRRRTVLWIVSLLIILASIPPARAEFNPEALDPVVILHQGTGTGIPTPAAIAANPSENHLTTGPAAPSAVRYPIPRAGDQRLLVVLVDFPDRPGLFTGQDWRNFFFGPEGFADYYHETSYNMLRYSGDIAGLLDGAPIINSSNVAYVRLPHPITFYADGKYGYKVNAGQFPKNHGGVVYHALQALNTAGFDFAPYANPATQVVENMVVIFAGSTYRYTQDAVNTLEATAYRLAWAGAPGGSFTSTGGQRVDDYTFCPDQFGNLSGEIARIGICTHEHGHALGMSDLYDFSYTTSGAGLFDIMAYGTFGASGGQRPFHFGAFTKYYYGWVSPIVPQPGSSLYNLQPVETSGQIIQLYPDGDTSSREYFLLEHRQPSGFDSDWVSAGLCAGLVIWRIDQLIFDNHPYTVNTLPEAGGPPHQGVILVEADGDDSLITPPVRHGNCSDVWQVGESWGPDTSPSSNLWDGTSSNLSVDIVQQCTDGSLSLRITIGRTADQLAHTLAWDQPGSPFTLFFPTVMHNRC